MKVKTALVLSGVLFAAVVKDEVVSWIILCAIFSPYALKFVGTMLDGHAHPGKYSEK